MTQDCEELIIHVLAGGGLGVGHMLRRPLFPTPVRRKKMCNRRENTELAQGLEEGAGECAAHTQAAAAGAPHQRGLSPWRPGAPLGAGSRGPHPGKL